MRIIDSHVYVGESLFDQHQSVEDLISLMDTCGVSQIILAPNKPKTYSLCSANRMVKEVVKQYPAKFLGWARVDPWQKESAVDELKKAHDEYGFCGLILHPWEELFPVSGPIVDPLMKLASQYQMPVMVEAGYSLVSHPLDIAELAKRFPEVTVIGTHGLQLDSSAFALTDAEIAMHECPNLIMETSGMYAPFVMEKLVQDLGVERLIFGSHTPWMDMRLEVERINYLNLTSAQKEAIFAGNIKRILNIE